MSGHLDETTRLTIRNTLLANPDLDLDATMSTAISHLLSPIVAAYVAAERDRAVREALDDAEKEIEEEWRVWYCHGHAPKGVGFNALMAACDRVSRLRRRLTGDRLPAAADTTALLAALPDDREGEGA